jgi:beta-carotene 3-hydroxylase
MQVTTIVLCILIVIGTFLLWEFIAWFTHKYVMHGFLWSWHKSHHTKHNNTLERNDLFALVFSTPCIGLLFYATLINFNPYLIAVGIGIFCYGLFYLIFHDVIVHQRIKWRPSKKSRYLQRIINAHYVHHSKHTREGCEAFGFLVAPKKYEPKSLSKPEKRSETPSY